MKQTVSNTQLLNRILLTGRFATGYHENHP
jgi:hypothetical protein